jgi:hypothetical protein
LSTATINYDYKHHSRLFLPMAIIKLPLFERFRLLKHNREDPDTLTDDEKAKLDILLQVLYRKQNTFYSQDDEGFPWKKIQTSLAGETFHCMLARESTFDSGEWKDLKKISFYNGKWPPQTINDLVGVPGLKHWACINCFVRNGTCHCSYPNWVASMQHFWISSIVIKEIPQGGHGLFAKVRIPANKVLGEYTGHLRPSDKNASNATTVYTARIPIGPQRRDKGGSINHCWIDGTHEGSVFRFLNHSCEPNAQMPIGRVGNKRRVTYVWTTRVIEVGEEITINYGMEYFKGESCWCGTASCKKPLKVNTLEKDTAQQMFRREKITGLHSKE